MQSLIEYARHHGLVKDHLEVDPLRRASEETNLVDDCEPDQQSDIISFLRESAQLPAERLTCSSEALIFLQKSTQPPAVEASGLLLPSNSEARRHQQLKVEPPLLRTDPQHDLRAFKQRIEPDLANETPPCMTIDDGVDEEIECPSKYLQYATELWHQIRSERLAIPVSSLRYLKSCIEPPLVEESIEKLLAGDGGSGGRHLAKSLPVLLPLSPENSPRSAPNSVLPELSSTPTDFSIDGIHSTSRSLLEKGVASSQSRPYLTSSSDILDNFSPYKGTGHARYSCSPEQLTTPRLQLKGSLSPASFQTSVRQTKKNVSFADNLEEGLPDLQCLCENPERCDEHFEGFNENLDELSATEATPIIKKENVEVQVAPDIDDLADHSRQPQVRTRNIETEPKSLPHPSTSAHILDEIKAIDSEQYLWPADSDLEQELSRTPLSEPRSGTHVLEKTETEDFVASHITPVVDTNPFTSTGKPKSLVFDPDKLEEATFSQHISHPSHLSKRKFKLGDGTSTSPEMTNKFRRVDGRSRNQGEDPAIFGNLLGSNSSNAIESLGVFFSCRTGNMDHLRTSREVALPSAIIDSGNGLKQPSQTQGIPTVEAGAVTLPEPLICMPPDSGDLIFSTNFLLNRPVMNHIATILPDISIIERDLNLRSSPGESSIEANQEADIIISPDTAILTTTLQKIKQRPLPGSEGDIAWQLTPLQNRILRASQHYERFIVLVSQNLKSTSNIPNLAPSDCEAMAEFTAFCTSLNTGVAVLFVAGGAEQLARWIVSLMIKHVHSQTRVRLTELETPEEQFLRSAGFNSFAAQVVIAQLKEKGVSGVGSFLLFSIEENSLLFGGLPWARKSLDRLHVLLKVRW